jgi:putative outer membrane protein
LYWEYGFGIENIGLGNFRFIRVDFVWRSEFNDVNGVRNPKFGIRLGVVPSF